MPAAHAPSPRCAWSCAPAPVRPLPPDRPGERMSTRTASQRTALNVVTAIFFMWGFITAFNDVLIPHLKSTFTLNYTQAMLVQFVFFGAYFIMSLPSGKVLAWLGYRRSIIA